MTEARFPRGASVVSQIAYNILSPPGGSGGATCNGDKQTVTLTVSTALFSPTVTVFSNQFSSPGDVGKAVKIPGAGNGGGDYFTTILTVGAFNGTSQTLTMSTNAGTALTSQSKSVIYGNRSSR